MADDDNGDVFDALSALAEDTGAECPVGQLTSEARGSCADDDTELDALAALADETDLPSPPCDGTTPHAGVQTIEGSLPRRQDLGSRDTDINDQGCQSPPQLAAEHAATGTAGAHGRRALPKPTAEGPAAFGRAKGSVSGAEVSRGTSGMEPNSGLRIKNPKFPSIVLRERLADLAFIKIGQLGIRAKTIDGAWATIGVLVEKMPQRQSANGKSYSLWRISDLSGGATSLFLFDHAHDAHWRLQQGTLLAVFHAKVRIGDQKDVSLTATTAEQLVELGAAADFGFCQSDRKDGKRCKNPVNVSQCRFCEFHVAAEFRKLQPKRGQFMDSMLSTAFRRGPVLKQQTHREKAAEVMPAARSRSLHSTDLRRVAEAGFGRKGGLGSKYLASAAASARQHERAGGTAGLQPLRPDPTTYAAAAKKPAHGIPARNVAVKRPADTYGAGLALAEAKRINVRSVPAPGPHLQPSSGILNSANHRESGVPGASFRARGQFDEEEEMVVLMDDDIDFGAAPRSDYGCDDTRGPLTEANRRAAQLVRERASTHVRSRKQYPESELISPTSESTDTVFGGPPLAGGIAAPDPNKKRRSAPRIIPAAAPPPTVPVSYAGQGPRGTSAASGQPRPPSDRTNLMAPIGYNPVRVDGARSSMLAKLGMGGRGGGGGVAAGRGGGSRGSGPASGKGPQPSAFGAAFGAHAVLGADPAAESRYKELADDVENDEMQRVMGALERKDEMALKMDSVKSMKVSAWQCKECGYTAEYPRKECRPAGHSLTKLAATVKLWWTCRHCSFHFATVAVRHPKHRCAKCKHPEALFAAATMLKKQKGPDEQSFAEREKFCARGVEHGMYLQR